MADGSLTIKRTITVRAVVTPRWKEDAERELSNAIANVDAQLSQLEQEGQQLVDEIRRQSANPLDPRAGAGGVGAGAGRFSAAAGGGKARRA
jgi:hypothetical protein